VNFIIVHHNNLYATTKIETKDLKILNIKILDIQKMFIVVLGKLQKSSFLKIWYMHKLIGFLQAFLEVQICFIDFVWVHSEFLF
jgi:hypothetical protein